MIFRQRLNLDKTRRFYSLHNFEICLWIKVTADQICPKMTWGMGSCSSSPSTIGYPDFKPTFIHLITLKLFMHLFLVLWFSKNSKISPTSNPWTTGLPKLVLPILNQLAFVWSQFKMLFVFFLSFPIGDFWNFPRIWKIHHPFSLWTGPRKYFIWILMKFKQ